jgi:hypothetical protein
VIENENTGRVEKLLLLEMPVRRAFQDGKAGLLREGDGYTAGKFRCADGLRDVALHGLAARGAFDQRRVGTADVVFKSVAAEFTRELSGNVKVQRHGGRSLTTGAARIEWKQAERSELADEWSHEKGRELNPALLNAENIGHAEIGVDPYELFYFRWLGLFNLGGDEVV